MDFTVTMSTVMERSHIALPKWLRGFYLMTSSKKEVNPHQLHRTLGIRRLVQVLPIPDVPTQCRTRRVTAHSLADAT